MKRCIIYIAVFLIAVLIPLERADIADLRPVQTVQLYRRGDTVVICTDTQDAGQGADALEALSNMKETALGIIYLDTAEYLLVSENAGDQIEALRAHLKASVTLYRCEAPVDTAAVTRYLHIHGNGPELKAWKAGSILPMLEEKDGSFILSKN